MVRYDDMCGDWLLSTSEGFYSLASPDAVPVKVEEAPPVSVMGLNVWQKDKQGNWLAGSFSGLFVWDRQQGWVTDYFTGEEAEDTAGPPFGKFAFRVTVRISRERNAWWNITRERMHLSSPANSPHNPCRFGTSLWKYTADGCS